MITKWFYNMVIERQLMMNMLRIPDRQSQLHLIDIQILGLVCIGTTAQNAII